MKHLQADLHTLFKPDPLPSLSFPLPSGPAYVRPMTIAAIKASVYYTYTPYLREVQAVHPKRIPNDILLNFSKPTFRPRAVKAFDFFQLYVRVDRIFRSYEDALIDMFINFSYTRDSSEFSRIQRVYPEYFI